MESSGVLAFIQEHIFEAIVTGTIGIMGTGFTLAIKYIFKRVKDDFSNLISNQNRCIQQLSDKVSKESLEQSNLKQGLLSVLHDLIYKSCMGFIESGEISADDLKNLEYLYTGYHELGGNGTGEELYNRCKKLPIK